MKRIITIWLIALGFTAQSQDFEWVETIDTDTNINFDLLNYITATDTQGNIYFTGIKDNVSFNCTDVMGSIVYNKYNSTGGLMFSKVFSGTGLLYGIKPDNEGNVILALGYTSSITIGATTLTAQEFTPNFSLVKLDPNGNLLWHSQLFMEDTEEWDVVTSFRAITTDSENNIYVGYDNFFNSFVAKYSPSGEQEMVIEQKFTSRITSLSVDSEGNIYAAGSCPSTQSTFGGVLVPSPQEDFYHTYLVKYNTAGEYQWVKYVKDITCPEPQVVTSGTAVYFSSALYEPLMFDDISVEGPSTVFMDFFLAKLNGLGEYEWVNDIPQTEGDMMIAPRNPMHVDVNGNVYIIGRTRLTINWSEEIITETEGFSFEAIVLKYKPSGEISMAKTIGGINSDDRFDAISSNADGDIFLSGMVTGGTVNFGNITREYADFQVVPFLTKMSMGSLGTSQFSTSETFIYPNPASKEIYISNMLNGIKGEIFNALGQKVMDFTITENSPIIIDKLAAGTYMIRTEDLKASKFIKY